MSRLPPLNALRVFRSAAEKLSFKAAAEQLHVTQAAVSQQIRMLENELGLALFHRHHREVALTTEGQRLLPFVQRGFRSFEEGFASLQQDPTPSLLTITALPSFASRWLMPRLASFQALHPEINIRISPTRSLEPFANSGTDLAIRFGRGDYPGLTSKLLLEDRVLPVCHPGLIDPDRPLKPQLAELPILADEGPDHDQTWERFRAMIDLPDEKQQSKLQVSDSSLLVEALLCGQGLSVLRYSLAGQLLEQQQLICPLRCFFESPYRFYLVAPEQHFKRPKVQLFERWIRDEIAQIDISWERFRTTHLKGVESSG